MTTIPALPDGVLPLLSPLATADQAERLQRELARRLSRAATAGEPAARFLAPDERPGPRTALAPLTGGTEHRALEAAASLTDPVVLLAHPAANSLPAALEILAKLRGEGRDGRIILLRDDGPVAARTGETALSTIPDPSPLAGARLGLIGAPSDWLVASRPDAAVVRRSWGVELVSLTTEALEAAFHATPDSSGEALLEATGLRAFPRRDLTEDALLPAARLAAALRTLVEGEGLDAVTVRCFDLLGSLGTTGCLALALLNDAGVVAGCEGDVPATVTMMWLTARYGGPCFMANPQDLDSARRRLWLAHCSVPLTLAERRRLEPHDESGVGVAIAGTLSEGPVVVARVGGPTLDTVFELPGRLVANECVDGRCRTQVVVELDGDPAALLSRPLGNHVVLAHTGRRQEGR